MEERRGDYPKILDTLSEIKAEMSKFAAMVEERNITALQWRSDVCKKFDKIFKWLEELPCRERKLNTKLMWGAIVFVAGLIVAHLGWK